MSQVNSNFRIFWIENVETSENHSLSSVYPNLTNKIPAESLEHEEHIHIFSFRVYTGLN
jgi:hypothetical protein